MRGAFVAIAGAAAIALLVLALFEHEQRAGPWDLELSPAPVPFSVEGGYHARPFNAPILGLCPQEPCAPHTAIDLRFPGLPLVTYEARLEGATQDPQDLGPLVADGVTMVLRWSQASDQTDKTRLVLALAGRDIATIPVQASPQPLVLDQTHAASWPVSPGTARLNEIGGVTISTVVKLRVGEAPPPGWEYHAILYGQEMLELGAFRVEATGAEMDARIERLALEDQQRLVVVMRPTGHQGAGFPVLHSMVPAS